MQTFRQSNPRHITQAGRLAVLRCETAVVAEWITVAIVDQTHLPRILIPALYPLLRLACHLCLPVGFPQAQVEGTSPEGRPRRRVVECLILIIHLMADRLSRTTHRRGMGGTIPMGDRPKVSMAATMANPTSTMEGHPASVVVTPGEAEVIEEEDTVAHRATDATTILPETPVAATVVTRST